MCIVCIDKQTDAQMCGRLGVATSLWLTTKLSIDITNGLWNSLYLPFSLEKSLRRSLYRVQD